MSSKSENVKLISIDEKELENIKHQIDNSQDKPIYRLPSLFSKIHRKPLFNRFLSDFVSQNPRRFEVLYKRSTTLPFRRTLKSVTSTENIISVCNDSAFDEFSVDENPGTTNTYFKAMSKRGDYNSLNSAAIKEFNLLKKKSLDRTIQKIEDMVDESPDFLLRKESLPETLHSEILGHKEGLSYEPQLPDSSTRSVHFSNFPKSNRSTITAQHSKHYQFPPINEVENKPSKNLSYKKLHRKPSASEKPSDSDNSYVSKESLASNEGSAFNEPPQASDKPSVSIESCTSNDPSNGNSSFTATKSVTATLSISADNSKASIEKFNNILNHLNTVSTGVIRDATIDKSDKNVTLNITVDDPINYSINTLQSSNSESNDGISEITSIITSANDADEKKLSNPSTHIQIEESGGVECTISFDEPSYFNNNDDKELDNKVDDLTKNESVFSELDHESNSKPDLELKAEPPYEIPITKKLNEANPSTCEKITFNSNDATLQETSTKHIHFEESCQYHDSINEKEKFKKPDAHNNHFMSSSHSAVHEKSNPSKDQALFVKCQTKLLCSNVQTQVSLRKADSTITLNKENLKHNEEIMQRILSTGIYSKSQSKSLSKMSTLDDKDSMDNSVSEDVQRLLDKQLEEIKQDPEFIEFTKNPSKTYNVPYKKLQTPINTEVSRQSKRIAEVLDTMQPEPYCREVKRKFCSVDMFGFVKSLYHATFTSCCKC